MIKLINLKIAHITLVNTENFIKNKTKNNSILKNIRQPMNCNKNTISLF
jgi:hypothetical protein